MDTSEIIEFGVRKVAQEDLSLLRKEVLTMLKKDHTIIQLHLNVGIGIRNHIRKALRSDQKRQQTLPELEKINWLDDNWEEILLRALQFTPEEYDQFDLEQWLTSDDVSVRSTALLLQKLKQEL